MEHHHRYHEERHFGGITDHYLQPAWLCLPQIKIENDLNINRCPTSPYSNIGIHSEISDSRITQDSLGCNVSYSKGGMSLSKSPIDYCNERRGMSTDHSNSSCYSERNNIPTQGSNTSTTNDNLCLNQDSTSSRFLNSDQLNEDQLHEKQEKNNESHNWCSFAGQNEKLEVCLSPGNKHEFCAMSPQSCEKSNCKTIEGDGYESRQAFDLTCRNKSVSKEGDPCTDSDMAVNDDSSGASTQARCSPKSQTCKICGKVLSSPSSYYVHMKLHSGNKPYACTMCEASFCRKPYLEVHMRTHTGERPFVCGTCNKRFTQKSSLNTHKRVHTGERPYSCEICHKTFAVKSYVTAHRWSHVSEKPLGCQHCGQTFTSKNLFALHVRTHIDQNHECHICGRTFMKESYLIRHQNRVHRDTPSSETNESRSPSLSPTSMNASFLSIAS